MESELLLLHKDAWKEMKRCVLLTKAMLALDLYISSPTARQCRKNNNNNDDSFRNAWISTEISADYRETTIK